MAKKKTEAVTDDDVATLPEAEFKTILLSDIRPDPNQPRRFFDEQALQELTDSVREKGVLQPVLVRPDPEGKAAYMIVCGERRYRAAEAVRIAFKSRNTIPAVIRELNESEALELQIIENLQRKNVHAMEEAAGFLSLVGHKQLTVDEIAARVGKSVYYVRQRLKLNDLIPEFQKAFFEGRLVSNKDALEFASFPVETQKEIWKEVNDENQIEANHWQLRSYRGKLSDAPFDLTDPTLDKKAGACTICPFNTAAASLFPDAENEAICTNPSCFKHKCDIHFDRELARAKEDPGVIFVNDSYSAHSDKLTTQLEKEGFTYINSSNRFDELQMPEKPDRTDYDREDYDDDKEYEEAWLDALKEYDDEMADYQKNRDSGKYKKVFCVAGSDKGKYLFVKFNQKVASTTSSKATSAKESAGTITEADIDEEIKRIQEREKRAKELDMERIHSRIIEAVEKDETMEKVPESTIPSGWVLLNYVLWNEISIGPSIAKALNLKPSYRFFNNSKELPILKEGLSNLSMPQAIFLVRQIILEKHKGSSPERLDGYMFRLMADGLGTIPIDAFETEQKEIADKRLKRVNKRLAELKAKKAELKKEVADSKPKAKKKK